MPERPASFLNVLVKSFSRHILEGIPNSLPVFIDLRSSGTQGYLLPKSL